MDLAAVGAYYVQYVFGGPVGAMLALLYMIALFGIRFGWSLDTFIVVLTPTLTLLVGMPFVESIKPIVLFILGLILGFGLLALIRR